MHLHRLFTRPAVLLAVLAVLPVAAGSPARAADAPASGRERELLAVLRSDQPAAKKAITCKLLAIHGSGEAVPELAQLLSDEQLASWARIALEAIPGEAADRALREATASLDGKLLVGTINSIGVRGDAEAVDLLTTHMERRDPDVASAAAVALGKIGNAAAASALMRSLTAAPEQIRSAIAEGCILCAEQLIADGNPLEAAKIYDAVRQADVPWQRGLEATRGAILARGQDGIPLLLEQFRSPDQRRFQLALSTAREFPGAEVDKALAAEMVRATPHRAALIIHAMADRPDTVVVSAVLKAASQGPQQVRTAAIRALRSVGDASCLAALLEIALEGDASLADAAKTTLADLPGDAVNAQIVAQLPKSDGERYALLIELVGRRRIHAAMPALLEALDHSGRDVRSAALAALGETIALDKLPVLISQVVAPKHSDDAPAAVDALLAASVRMRDREACAEQLAAAIERTSSVPTKNSLLRILGAVGGTHALATIGAAAKSSDPRLQDVSSRLLGEWMTADAAPVLLDLAKTAPNERYRIRALRGYIRIARQFDVPRQQRAEMCRKALEASRRTAEQKLVLEVLKRYPNEHTLKLAVDAMRKSELTDQATEVALDIAEKLREKGIQVGELLSEADLEKVRLEIVKAEYGAGATQQDVTDVLRKQAGDHRLITLPSPSFNASLGGDPLPGTAKKLKIQYRINGKAGEATFEENAVILLPMPE